jgi:serine/threonine-protein kinase
MSYFHTPGVSFGLPAIFTAGNWNLDLEKDDKCPNGAMFHGSQITQLPLPAPPQNPITLLTGHGRASATAAPCQAALDTTIDQTFTRTGD